MKLRLISLKKILGVGAIATSLLLTAAIKSEAGVWNLSSHFAEKEATAEEIEQFLVSSTERASAENPIHYLTDVYKAIFEPQAVKIPFRYTKETVDGEDILQAGTMYYSKGDLFILNEMPEATNWTTNFATINGELYTWESGEKSGLKLTRFKGDTIELLDYWIDPALIMRFTYLDYQAQPEAFEVIAQPDEKLYLKRKNVPNGFVGMRIEESPHWMSALVTRQCGEEGCLTDEIFALEVDRPIPIDAIPDAIKGLPEDVTFEPSEQTADSYMTYL